MPLISSYSLIPLKGEIKKEDLLHLLRRTLFGVGYKDLHIFKNKNVDQCLDILLTQSPQPKAPLQDDPDIIDPLVPAGKDWTSAPFENDDIDKARRIALRSWWTGQIINRDFSLTAKMTLFWHNHFVTEMDMVKDSRYSYRYVALLHKHAIGNFKELIKEGTTNVAMLVYLNGNSNRKAAPNENYSRELMELFTLGKNKDVHYTEDDVKAAARVLSGWKDNKNTIESDFIPVLHDTEDKQFSAFFNNKVIRGKTGNEGIKEIDELIEIIFAKKETARFFCRNIYRWFVSAHIDEAIEQHIIAPLGELLIAHNFDVKSVLRTLLSSQHFFDTAFRGCIVKDPVAFYVGAIKQFDIEFPANLSNTHLCWAHIYFNIGGLSMSIGDPPSVAGWPAFYQAPKYHQWWINSYTLGFRMKIAESLYAAEGANCNGPRIKFDFISFVKQLSNPENVNDLVNECLDLLFAVQISEHSKDKLKSILLSEQKSDYYWKEAWRKFADTPQDSIAKSVVENRLTLFFGKIMNMPEYQMM